MSKKTLSLATPRPPTASTPARKAGVRMVKARVRGGEGPEAPARSEARQPRDETRRPRQADQGSAQRQDDRRPRRADSEPSPARPWGAPEPAAARGPRDARPATPGPRERPQAAAPRKRPARAAAPAAAAKPPSADRSRPLAAAPPASAAGLVRVSKLLAERGLCSRREADEYIDKGWVWADGERVTQLGTRVAPDATLRLDERARSARARLATILLHKPVGYVSGQPEDDHPPAMALIRPENLWHEAPLGSTPGRFDPAHLRGLAPAGRLDIESTGLLVLTQDGTVARQLIGADSAVDKEYLVRVEGELAPGGLALLNHGLSLDDEPLRPARVEWLNEDQLRFVLREGRKRQIRRMCEQVGLRVTGLKRVRIGGVMLGDLPVGRWRYLVGETF